MGALLLSVHPLLKQCLLHLHHTHMTDRPTYWPQYWFWINIDSKILIIFESVFHITFSLFKMFYYFNIYFILFSPGGTDGKESTWHGLGRSPRGGNGCPLQYSWLENSMNRGRLQSMGLQRVRQNWEHMHMHIGYEGKCQSLETKEDTGKKSWEEQKWTFLLPLGMERQQVVSQGEDSLVGSMEEMQPAVGAQTKVGAGDGWKYLSFSLPPAF